MSQENVEVVRRWWGGHEGVRRWREQVFEAPTLFRARSELSANVRGSP